MKLAAKIPWIQFKPSLCRSCWASCCHNMPVQVSVKDLIRLELLTAEQAAGDLESALKILRRRKILKKGKANSLIFTLAQKKSGDCLFLDKKRACTVYANRPEICRRFPVKASPKPGYCPYKAI